MARLTRITGIVLMVLGVVYFVLTGSTHPTSLIPTWWGAALLGCGIVANTDDARRRMLWMHIAVTVGLIGLLFPGFMGVRALTRWSTLAPVHRTAAGEQLIMAAVCLVFTALCVRSFIAARTGRTA